MKILTRPDRSSVKSCPFCQPNALLMFGTGLGSRISWKPPSFLHEPSAFERVWLYFVIENEFARALKWTQSLHSGGMTLRANDVVLCRTAG
jgi:hypothetical protein